MPARETFEEMVAGLVKGACARVREADAKPDGLARRSVRTLRREDGTLSAVTVPEIDWDELEAELGRPPAVWEDLAQRTSWGSPEPDGPPSIPDPNELPGEHLWARILISALRAYHAHRPDLQWDEELARRSIAEWADGYQSRTDGHRRTLAPLYNVDGPDEPLAIEENLVIRPFADAERGALWRWFGAGESAGESGPTPLDLERWSHAIDYRWTTPDGLSPLDHRPGAERVQEVVRALRLLRPSMAGAALIWTRPDPPVEQGDPFDQAVLSAPAGGGVHDVPIEHIIAFGVEAPARVELAPADGETLGELVRRLDARREDRRLTLALRRFDSAYERYSDEDRLIDLWIAFEALLLPDGQTELSYRAAMRIALLAAEKGEDRATAFEFARRSYACRSKVVHGETVARDFEAVVEQTRDLARKVLAAWLFEPVGSNAKKLDERIFK